MSTPWWALALIGLCNLGADGPSLKVRITYYVAVGLLVLAVVIDWL
jgi:hypothetical protein